MNSFEHGLMVGMLLNNKSPVPPVIEPLRVIKNGTYRVTDDVNGFDPVTVDLPIVSKTIIENGTYNASSDGAEGFDPVIVNVKTYKEEYEEMKSIVDFLKQSNTDDSDSIDVMLGIADVCNYETETHTYNFKIRYTRFISGVDQGIGSKGDRYDVNIILYRDGELYKTFYASINARTEDSAYDDGYGVDQLEKCVYFSTDQYGSTMINYRYYSLGAWASYDQWNKQYI